MACFRCQRALPLGVRVDPQLRVTPRPRLAARQKDPLTVGPRRDMVTMKLVRASWGKLLITGFCSVDDTFLDGVWAWREEWNPWKLEEWVFLWTSKPGSESFRKCFNRPLHSMSLPCWSVSHLLGGARIHPERALYCMKWLRPQRKRNRPFHPFLRSKRCSSNAFEPRGWESPTWEWQI